MRDNRRFRIALVGALALIAGVALAQVLAPTRISTYDWQCQDANGARISDHQRIELAMVACLNSPNGAYVQGGRYRVNRSSQPVAGTARLRWTPPTTNTDGTPLTNLAGYRISYGRASDMLTQTVQLAQPAVATYVMEGMAPGTWYFAVRAYNSTGSESALSNVASKVVM